MPEDLTGTLFKNFTKFTVKYNVVSVYFSPILDNYTGSFQSEILL
jgi:hypothetical protein